MQIPNRAKKSSTPKRALSFVLMLSMIISMMIPAFGFSAAAAETGTDVVLMSLTREAATAAEAGNQFDADSGVYAGVSNLTAWSNNTQRAVGGTGRTPIVFNNAQTTGGWKPVSVAGLDNADAFQIKLSTLGYENIRFTCSQKSTGSGPDAFLLAYSIGNPEGPYTVISGSETGTNGIPVITRVSNDTYAALRPSYDNFVLPADVENESEVYLRVIFNGLTNLGANGNTSINDIVIIGDGEGGGTVNPPVVDKTALSALIDSAFNKVQSDYTAESWTSFVNALNGAVSVFTDANATQAQVNNAITALSTAMNALVVYVPVIPGGETDVVLMSLTRTAANATADAGNQFNADSGIFASVSNLTAWNRNMQVTIGYAGSNRTPVVFNNASCDENLTGDDRGFRSVGSAAIDAGITVDTASAFQLKFETTGYENIRLSCTQKSTGSGPENFMLAYSIGSPTGSYTTIPGSRMTPVRASNDTYSALAPSYVDFELPAELENKSEVYLRFYLVDSGYDTVSGRRNGNTAINDIVIIGDVTDDKPVIPGETDVTLMTMTRTAANATADAGNQFDADSGVFARVSNLTAWNRNMQVRVGYAGSNRTPIVFNNASCDENLTGDDRGFRSVGPAAIDAGITVDTASAFQLKFETTGYENIRLSCTQKSTGSGPQNFMLAYSVGSPTGPYTTIPGSRMTPARASNDTYSALQPTYVDFVLPAELENQSEVYLRFYLVDSEYDSVSGRRNGNTSINDIVIVGDEIGGTTKPTVNKTALRALIATASEKVQSEYTADSWFVFAQAYEAAQIVAANSSATQAAVDAAKSTLQSAMDALKKQNVPGGEGKPQSQWGTFVNEIPNNISNTFTADPKTTRTITWQTGTGVSGEVIIGGVKYPAATTTIGTKNHHRVDLTGLTPGATYTYVCGTEGAYSNSYSFTTEKANSIPFSIIHVTDPQMGAGSGNAADAATWKRVMEAAITAKPNPAFVVNTGDVVNSSVEASIPFYFDYAQDILASNAFVYSMGNNDTGAWYNRYFYTPDNGPRSEIYSFEYGNALFINIDSNVSGLANNAAFMNWFEDTLKNSDATWKVVMMHQGFFGRSASPNAITDMMYKYGVDLALIGHNHFYYRSYMIDGRGNLVDEGGVVWSLPQSAGNKQNDTASNRKDMAMNATPGPMFSTFDFNKGSLVLNAYTVNAQGVATLYDTYTLTKEIEETEGPTNIPTHITTARGEKDNAIGFSWYSDSAASANVIPLESVVQIAKKSDMVGNEFPAAKSTTYSGVPVAASTGKYSNQVSVTGLDFSTEYVYRVGNGTSNNWSDVGSFKTGGGAGSAFSFLYASDAQVTNPSEAAIWKNTLDKALAKNPDAAFMVHTGDQVDTANSETEFNAFFTPQASLLNMPLMPLTGNHDRANNFGWHFNVPQNGAAGIQKLGNANYWYMYGDALFLVLDQASNITTQINWMRDVIAANPSKWIIASFHETVYSVYGRGPTNRDALNAAFAELNVDLVLQGHDHSWMRSHIMKDGVATAANVVDGYCANPDGTVILNIGGAGAKQYTMGSGGSNGNASSPWVASCRNGEPMYAVIGVTADTLTINAYLADSTVAFDTFAIKKTSAAVVDKSALAAVIEIAVAKVETNYTVESWAAVAAALVEAQQVYANTDTTQEQVDAAVIILANALNALVEKPVISRAALTAAIKAALAKDEALYTPESWAAFDIVFKDILRVHFNDDATQAQIDAATAGLMNAMNKLVAKVKVILVSASASAYVTKLNGNQNDLTITVTEKYSDGSTNLIKATVRINNNAAGTYTVGGYKVYVDTKGNDQIRECRIVEIAEAA